jgi:hypothetical protein
MQYPQPVARPQAYRPRQYVVRGSTSSPLRAVLARVPRPHLPHREGASPSACPAGR